MKVYKDIDIAFFGNPITYDLSSKKGVEAISQSLKNLVLTNTYERPYKPEIGTGLTKLLGEPISSVNVALMKKKIHELIKTYEPRVELVEVDVKANNTEQAYKVYIKYNIINTIEIYTETITLKRI